MAASLLSGTFVVTGGFGALGTFVALWLNGLGVSDVQLLGRSGRTSERHNHAIEMFEM